jgi:hypothetical protein
MSTIFSLTAQLLLEQKMICEVSHDTYFDWLIRRKWIYSLLNLTES